MELDIPETRNSETPADPILADSTSHDSTDGTASTTPNGHVVENPQSEGIEHLTMEHRRSTRTRKPPERFEE